MNRKLLLCRFYLERQQRQTDESDELTIEDLISWHIEERKRKFKERHYLTKASLIQPEESAWYQIFHAGDDSAFLVVTGLNRKAFFTLLEEFQKFYVVKSGVGKPGRPRTFRNVHAVLGALLYFYSDKIEHSGISLLFGAAPSTECRTMDQAEQALEKALKKVKEARIRWPSYAQQVKWASLIEAREPLVKRKWGFIDGKNLEVNKSSDTFIQNTHYNGWLHRHTITGVLCFGADGTLVWARHNCPGSWNDAQMSNGIMDRLRDPLKTLPGYGLVADTAFPATKSMAGIIVSPLKLNEIPPADVLEAAEKVSSAITSLRQACEWGMGSIGKVYGKLNDKHGTDKIKRGRRISNIFRLWNLRVRMTGISQISTVMYEDCGRLVR